MVECQPKSQHWLKVAMRQPHWEIQTIQSWFGDISDLAWWPLSQLLLFKGSVPGLGRSPGEGRGYTQVFLGFPGGSAGKESACSVGDLGSIPGLGRSPGEGKGCPLQYPGLENPMDWIVHGATKSRTWLSKFHFHSLSHVWLFCNPMDCSPPASSVHGISQVRILEWVVICFSRGSSQPRDWTHISCISGGFFYYWATREAHQGI